ncbi:alpha/beta fold hydrolase [Nocardia puris]|uniref:2-hydroxy-6-oxonona-2,4-dienedioate hydrolase/4,5:9,10-diseco-3-hydroxy-5,9, 17-trioxoandrosta-1(10),2-diene-4-oate hydrolase n=1 Tax=Nocardia puris TaxID=208602 RepID=A0A366DUG2_9NOCA|nr:alpha/beta fold hydrolase [Nocardia puris]MBF6210308.1 alpha/beta fold hydrolase [Nocardia puris]MBF6367383.1 alpha/beta fold hydrolase [Nocardia puris]MBF6457568.1 alpha/beta fold hydrolase [Nocardia puris]RBO93730.1 2-hydroxy-6-oxonona-2,4-dienedioate hydrolase/4,5:9,10-diseco-3-hydroxy-5,9,17-trioxoandrosta-1(10),2-diene-4-oate hydrolase [Nocardia puris]
MAPTETGTARHVRADGLDLRYHEAGSGPPLVLLHGSGPGVSGWANFGANLPALAARFRCLILDQPGFGDSARPAVYDRNYLRIAADAVLALLDALEVPRAHLLGNSMGGAVATLVALEHGDRVDRLVLMAPGGVGANVLGPEPSEGIRRLLDFLADPGPDRVRDWLRTMVSDPATLTEDLVRTRLAAATDPAAVAALRDAYATFADPALAERVPLWARLRGLRHEVLLLWGRDDRVTPPEGALLPSRQLPNADLRYFGRCGHWVQIERKAAFERAVLDFLTHGHG